jgi:predicted DNA-binding transcriptional regulator AlpA
MARKPKRRTARDEPVAPTPQLALTILQFCSAHGISEGFFYKLKKQKKGPREMKLGARTLITLEAAAAWRAKREAASVAASKTVRSSVQDREPETA